MHPDSITVERDTRSVNDKDSITVERDTGSVSDNGTRCGTAKKAAD